MHDADDDDDDDDVAIDAGVDSQIANRAPVASAGFDLTVGRGTRVTLDGAASHDPDGDPLAFHWQLATAPATSSAAIVDPSAAITAFTVDQLGTYQLQLTVDDGALTSPPDFLRITVLSGMPVAHAGPDQTVPWRAVVQLDGRASVDSDGDPLQYVWTLTTRPAGSVATLGNPTSAQPQLQADRPGIYEASLVVTDGESNSAPDTVRIVASNGAPVARAGADSAVALDTLATLDGSATTDPDGDPLSYAWTVTSAPAGSSAAPLNADLATSSFIPAVAGTYTLTLTVSDGAASSTDSVQLVAFQGGDVGLLTHDVIDAEYSNALDAIVMVSDDHQALYVRNPDTGVETAVALPLTPTAVSVSPDGLEAAVGHDGWVSIVNLSTKTLVSTLAVTTDALDVIHGGNGWVYVMPRHDQWEEIRCVQIATGSEQLGSGLIYAGAVGRRHPLRTSLYIADRGLSPADIELHDLTPGRSMMVRDSPYHGDFPMCGDLWFSDDGNRIFTACGNVFRSSTNAMTDMTYNGNLAGAPYIGFTDDSAQAGLVAVLPRNSWMEEDGDLQLRFYREDFLGLAGVVDLPPVLIGAQLVANHGRFVFWRADGSEYYVIMRATPTSGVPRDTVWTGTPPM